MHICSTDTDVGSVVEHAPGTAGISLETDDSSSYNCYIDGLNASVFKTLLSQIMTSAQYTRIHASCQCRTISLYSAAVGVCRLLKFKVFAHNANV